MLNASEKLTDGKTAGHSEYSSQSPPLVAVEKVKTHLKTILKKLKTRDHSGVA